MEDIKGNFDYDVIPVGVENFNLSKKEGEFSRIDKASENLENVQEDLLRDGKVPSRETAREVSTTDTIVDLALATLARTSAVKLIKMEKFISSIEDELLSEESLANMPKEQMLNIYGQLRMLRNTTLQNVRDIRKEVDFSELEVKIIAANAKGDMNSVGSTVNEVLDKIMNNADFLEKSIQLQKDQI